MYSFERLSYERAMDHLDYALGTFPEEELLSLFPNDRLVVAPRARKLFFQSIMAAALANVFEVYKIADGQGVEKVYLDVPQLLAHYDERDLRWIICKMCSSINGLDYYLKDVDFKLPAAKKNKTGPNEKHPWSTIPVNGTFRIPRGVNQPKITTIRVACSVKGRKLGRKFLCHQYPDGLIEVWRQR